VQRIGLNKDEWNDKFVITESGKKLAEKDFYDNNNSQ
jgi:hypothetical protein